jgi:hypothetical protein
MDQRILELAIGELTRRKVAIEEEIEEIRRELGQPAPAVDVQSAAVVVGMRRGRNASQRKAQSERMKKYWAARNSAKGSADSNPKAKTAAGKAISEAMRAYWAKRKASGKNSKAKKGTASK